MVSHRVERSRRLRKRLGAFWAAAAAGLAATGCQVDYAGMTLPSGKYMYDDVQYFPPGPYFPWGNTQAAAQRARMRAQGIPTGVEPAGAPGAAVLPGQPGNAPIVTPPPAAGALAPGQAIPGQPANVNVLEPEENAVPPGGAPGIPAPPGAMPPGGIPPNEGDASTLPR